MLIVLIDSVYEISKNYYPKAFLEECRYAVKLAKKYISDKIEVSSDEISSSRLIDNKICKNIIFSLKIIKILVIFLKVQH